MCILCKIISPHTETCLCDDCLDIYRSGALHAYGILGDHRASIQGSPAPEQITTPICPIETREMTAIAAESDLDALFSLRMFLYRIAREIDAHNPVLYSPLYAVEHYFAPLDRPK